MKSPLLLMFTLLISINIIGQNYLTHGQVYNFDIGDIFQIRCETPWNSSYPFKYETRTIANKTYSQNSDTIFYTVNIDTYTPPPAFCGSCTAVYTSSTVIQSITNLGNSAITHNNQSYSCVGPADSIITDGCGNLVWKKYPYMSLSCSGPPTQQTTFLMAGLGGPYYEYSGLGSGMPMPTYWAYRLIYYSKQIGGTCGMLVTSKQEKINPTTGFSIYPNPISNELNLNSIHDYNLQESSIFDITGKQVLIINDQKSIDVSKLNPGLYFIKIKTDQGEFSKKFIKE